MHNLPDFKLETYLAKHEFTVKYMLGSSDVESWSMSEIIALADEECSELWNSLSLGYTETLGLPMLREEIAELYNAEICDNNIMCFAGAEEGIYTACHSILQPEDHAIVITPCYQSLKAIPTSICNTNCINISHDDGWKIDISEIKKAIKHNTKLLVINFPHNPTGALISNEELNELISIAHSNDMWIFFDEVYRYLELDPDDSLEPVANLYDKALSLGVMSKSFGLAGIRIGWVATQNKAIINTLNKMKHYLSICNSAPAEILALIALRNKNTILAKNLGIVRSNIKLLNNFFADNADIIDYIPPKSGCIAFPRLKLDMPAYEFCKQLILNKNVLLLPGDIYGITDNHFRIGFGRSSMPEALAKVQEFIKEL